MSSFKYYSDADFSKAAMDVDIFEVIKFLEGAFVAYGNGDIILPEKASQILDEASQSRVNCMPCTVPNLGFSGVKLVSVFPNNVNKGKANVSGMVLMLSSVDGTPVAVLDAGFLTSLRTALVGGIASRFLAIDHPQEIALLGAGAESLMHFYVMSRLYPCLKKCRVASRSSRSEIRFREAAQHLSPEISIECCSSDYGRAVANADIIVTAISGQSPILKARWIKPGAYYCHVGGIEDEYGVALKADKIVCDSWEALKHRGSPTLSHMYRDGILTDSDIYAELYDLITRKKPGRESLMEFNYFNSIGMSFVDIYTAVFLMRECDKRCLGRTVKSPDFDIFSVLNLSEQAAGK